MKRLLMSYWRGEQPLWKTFWLAYVGGGIIYSAVSLAIVLGIFHLSNELRLTFHDASGVFPDHQKIKAFYWFIWSLLILPYHLFGTVSLWRCPIKNAKWPMLGYLACAWALFNFLKTIARIILLLPVLVSFQVPGYLVDLALQKNLYTVIVHPHPQNIQALQFAEHAAITVFTYDYQNYQQQFAQAQNYFSGQGWDAFSSALEKSHNLDDVKSKQLFVSSLVNANPVLLKKNVFLNQITWLIRVPITVTYRQKDQTWQSTQYVDVELLILEDGSQKGMHVVQFVAPVVK